MPAIVITDPLPFSEKQLARLEKLGDLTVFSTMPESDEELISRLTNNEAVISGWCNLTRTVLSSVQQVKFVSLWAAGTNLIDLEAARENNILVSTAKDYATVAVSEFTLAAILNLMRRVSEADHGMRTGVNDWRAFQGVDLQSKVVGVLGCGSIGSRVIKLLRAFEADIICCTEHPSEARAKALGVSFVDFDQLLSTADIVTIHVPLSSQTHHFFDERRLRLMKDGALLVNTSRGAIVDEAALLKVIEEGHLGGAAIDVYKEEPPTLDNSWYKHKNVLLTPHIAFNSCEAMNLKNEQCIANVENYFGNKSTNSLKELDCSLS